MTDKLRSAAQALVNRWDSPKWGGSAENLHHTGEYIAALRAALAEQPAEQEQVAWRDPTNSDPGQGCTYDKAVHEKWPHIYKQPLYTAPQPAIPPGWATAYAAFKGAFDTPLARRRDSGEYAQDARRLLREFNDAMLTAPEAPQPAKRVPLTPRELELIDGMIEMQLIHAERCDVIANRRIAAKQKEWDMERVELLRKIRAHGITGETE